MHEPVFALDIGTRKIAAFVMRRQGDRMEVVASRMAEHKGRAVRAGQIHDIEKVAALVSDLRDALQKETGLELKKVATAIAGRNLKCYRATGETNLEAVREITADDIRQAELSGIHAAITQIGPEIDEHYFVGHTIVAYRIDDDVTTVPLGHFAQQLSVELITTFLPRRVLESLFSVMHRAGLEIAYLTLEPIAAAEAVFPREMRHIPVALIDIGAGTADIALIADGSIQSFGMIPVAGDFITEHICGELLTDFNEAERIKRYLGDRFRPGGAPDGTITITDIFGRAASRTAAELMDRVLAGVREMARRIAAQIHEMAGTGEFTARNFAVVLVGGGGLTPYLDRELAAALGINPARIGLRLPAMMSRYSLGAAGERDAAAHAYVFGPQSAVTLGIASLAAESTSVALIHVTVNDKKIDLFNFEGGELNVLSALVAAGINKTKIYGRPGLAKIITVNGETRVIKGGMPRPARATVNDAPVALTAPVAEGDRIQFVPAIDGKNASLTAGELGPERGEITFNDAPLALPVEVLINGAPLPADAEIADNAHVEVRVNHSFRAILEHAGVPTAELAAARIVVDVLGHPVERPVRNFVLRHNGEEIADAAALDGVTVKAGDRIEFRKTHPVLRVGDFLAAPAQGRELRIKINEEEFVFPGGMGKILLNGREVNEDAEVSDGDILRTAPGRDAEAVLVDIFKYISFEPKDTVGKRLKLLVNHEEANFTTPLPDGADVRIQFE